MGMQPVSLHQQVDPELHTQLCVCAAVHAHWSWLEEASGQLRLLCLAQP